MEILLANQGGSGTDCLSGGHPARITCKCGGAHASDRIAVVMPFGSANGWSFEGVVRSQGNGLNGQFNPLADEEWIVLFETLEEWERYLAQLDSKSLRCDDCHFRR